jgi:fumarate reductase subunit D
MSGRRTLDPLAWMGFGAGGMVAALVLPACMAVLAVLVPLGVVALPPRAEILSLVSSPVVRVGLWLAFALCLFHWAHRFRYTLYDGLQIKHLNELIFTGCYGGAAAGAAFAAWVLAGLP